jgi:hypothetical protein
MARGLYLAQDGCRRAFLPKRKKSLDAASAPVASTLRVVRMRTVVEGQRHPGMSCGAVLITGPYMLN